MERKLPAVRLAPLPSVLFNTLKIAGAAAAAIALATLLRLDYAVSAGIVAILSVQPTKKDTVATAAGRSLAFVCALGIAFLCFTAGGFTLPMFCVYLAAFVFVCRLMAWHSSMAMNSVLVSHFLLAGNMAPPMLANECLIFAVGVGLGIVANLHLHKDVDAIERLKGCADDVIREVLLLLAEQVSGADTAEEAARAFSRLDDAIRAARNLAEENRSNQLFHADGYDGDYIAMRGRQRHELEEMHRLVRRMYAPPFTARRIADFLREVSRSYHRDNTVVELLARFRELDAGMKDAPLPAARAEFEDRARLFSLLRHLEEFLELKHAFAEAHPARAGGGTADGGIV